MIRAGLLLTVLASVIFGSSCASLVIRRDDTIPRLLTPLAEAKFDDLILQLQPFTDLQALRTSQVYLRFLDAEMSKQYPEAEAILILQRPDRIRLLIQAPVVKSKYADMVSENNRFKVAIYNPSEYRRFLIGTNDADYSAWKAKLGKNQRSALAEARPFHFTDALMMRPLHLNDSRFAYGLEEAMIEEPDTRPGAKKGARVLRSFYVISEVELAPAGQGPSRVRRRFWFDRTNTARFARQQVFDSRGSLMTEVGYLNYIKLSEESPNLWPGVVVVNRLHDGYSARLTFTEGKFLLNPELDAKVFALENENSLPVTDLDKPGTP
ncbi:MAG: hypothetical protein ACKVX9_04200 [Blastocatellia bacterium]